jgi:nitrite reductase/ring-hydroxylating ferredoxin subunit
MAINIANGVATRAANGRTFARRAIQSVRTWRCHSATRDMMRDATAATRPPDSLRHPVGISHAKLMLRTMFGPSMLIVDGRRIVFWRSEHEIVAMDDICVHRGSPLSRGAVARVGADKRSCLVCPYHHWAFDCDGRIADVPTEKEGRWPRRSVQRTYRLEFDGGEAVIYDDVGSDMRSE